MYYSEEKIKHIVNAATIIVTLKAFVLAQFLSKFIESLFVRGSIDTFKMAEDKSRNTRNFFL